MSERSPVSNAARVDRAAIWLVTDEEVADAARITALQVCAERGLLDVIPTALALARSATSIPLKISAIAALGAVGGTELVPWLEQLADDASQPQFQPAARAALQQLNKRLGIRATTLNVASGAQ